MLYSRRLVRPRRPHQLRFLGVPALAPQEIAAIVEQVSRLLLRWLVLSVLLDADDVGAILAWVNGGFSLDASVRIGGCDHAGLSIASERTGADPWIL